MKESPNDRISFSFSRKFNLGNFETADIYVGFSTDVDKDENKSEAMSRAKKFVYKELKKEKDKLLK